MGEPVIHGVAQGKAAESLTEMAKMAQVYLSGPAVALLGELDHRSRGSAGDRLPLSDSDAHSR